MKAFETVPSCICRILYSVPRTIQVLEFRSYVITSTLRVDKHVNNSPDWCKTVAVKSYIIVFYSVVSYIATPSEWTCCISIIKSTLG